jgi:hypothetical protein
METAKVDIRRLQILNDCINRTIEALNQVRLSVHGGGISHTAAIGGAFPGVYGYGGYGQPFFPQTTAMGVVPGLGLGLGHTANPFYNQNIYATNPFATNPYATNPFGAQTFGTNPLAAAAYLQNQGLAHTGPESVGANWNTYGANNWNTFVDPYVNARIAQTFPFVHWGYSPFGWGNV